MPSTSNRSDQNISEKEKLEADEKSFATFVEEHSDRIEEYLNMKFSSYENRATYIEDHAEILLNDHAIGQN